jgi:hypothetical protein
MKYIKITKNKDVINVVKKILEKDEITCLYFLFYDRLNI